MEDILAKPTKTANDFERLVRHWHDELMENEGQLLHHAQTLDHQQQSFNQTTRSFIQAQDLLGNLEKTLQQFQHSIDHLSKYNDDMQQNIDQLNDQSKTYLPNILGNVKTEQDRSITYDLLESVDSQLIDLETNINQLNNTLRFNTNQSIVKTTEDLQTCFHDLEQIQQTIEQIKF